VKYDKIVTSINELFSYWNYVFFMDSRLRGTVRRPVESDKKSRFTPLDNFISHGVKKSHWHFTVYTWLFDRRFWAENGDYEKRWKI